MASGTTHDNAIYKTFARNSLLYSVNAFIANASLFLINVSLARLLGAEDFAVIVLLSSIVGIFVVVSNFGISDAATKFIAEDVGKKELSSLVSSGISIFLLLSVAAAAILFAFSGYISRLFFNGDFVFYLRVSSIWVFFVSFVMFIRAVGMGLHRMNFVILGDMLYNPPKLLFILALLPFGVSVQKVVMGWTFLALAGLILIGIYFKNFVDRQSIRLYQPSLSMGKKLFGYGIYLYLPFLSFFVLNYVLTLQLGTLSSKEDVSFFAVSMSVVAVSFLLFMPVSKILMPTVSHIYALRDNNKLEVLGKILSKYIGITSLFVASVFCFGSAWILKVIYGGAYAPASPVLTVLSLAIFFETFKFITDPLLNGTEHASTVSRIEMAKLIIVLAAGFFLIRAHGAVGAAAAFLAGSAISCFLKIFMVNSKLKLSLHKETAGIFVLSGFLVASLLYGLGFFIFLLGCAVFIGFSRLVSLREVRTLYSLITE